MILFVFWNSCKQRLHNSTFDYNCRLIIFKESSVTKFAHCFNFIKRPSSGEIASLKLNELFICAINLWFTTIIQKGLFHDNEIFGLLGGCLEYLCDCCSLERSVIREWLFAITSYDGTVVSDADFLASDQKIQIQVTVQTTRSVSRSGELIYSHKLGHRTHNIPFSHRPIILGN